MLVKTSPYCTPWLSRFLECKPLMFELGGGLREIVSAERAGEPLQQLSPGVRQTWGGMLTLQCLFHDILPSLNSDLLCWCNTITWTSQFSIKTLKPLFLCLSATLTQYFPSLCQWQMGEKVRHFSSLLHLSWLFGGTGRDPRGSSPFAQHSLCFLECVFPLTLPETRVSPKAWAPWRLFIRTESRSGFKH